MTAMLLSVVLLTLINVLFKGIGPATLGNRRFSARVENVIDAFPAALLAGLLLVQLLGERWAEADASVLPGLAVAATGWHLRLAAPVCVVAAVAVTILLRLWL